MKKVQKGFTLVELIVVITILAILATIAFISLQGYSQDAKNSKVGSDLRTLSSAIETRLTEGMTLSSVLLATVAANSVDDNTVTFGYVSATTGTGIVIDEASNYDVGTINFVSLKQNGTDFKGPEHTATNVRNYFVAYAASGDVAYYQVAGQTKTASDDYVAVVKGNFVDEGTTDASGLIADSAADTGLVNGDAMLAADDLY